MVLNPLMRRIRCGRCATLPVWALVLTLAGGARAQSSADDLARRHFDSGVAYLEESDYENALSAFRKAYELSPRPEILLNIATVQERRGDLAGALAALREYLTQAPNGEHVETVKLRVKNLERRVPEEPAPEAAPDTAPAPAAPAPPPPPPAPAPPPEQDETGPDRTLAYVVLGAGAAFGVGAVVTGIMAKGEYDDAKDSCSPNCSEDELSSGRTLALTSTILTGAALVGAGVGVTLLFTGGSAETGGRSGRLEVGATVLPGGAGLRGSLRF
jgi:hypothetical protein